MKYSNKELNWMIIFGEALSKGKVSLIHTINGCLKKGAEKEYDKNTKECFLIAARKMFKGESTIDIKIIEELKVLFQTNETLLELQENLEINVFGDNIDD